MTKLYNLSLSQGIVPSSWKIATIISLPKEGDLKDVNNYRPVSLLPLPGNILEKLVHSRVMKHLEELHFYVIIKRGLGKTIPRLIDTNVKPPTYVKRFGHI